MEENANKSNSRERSKSGKNSAKSKLGKSKSRSPEKNVIKSGKTPKTPLKSGNKSKSPKRRLTASHKENRGDHLNESSIINEVPKSTPELEDLSSQGLTIISMKIFQKITLRKLILCGNNLRSLPSAIADLHNLEYLDISRNPLRVKDVDDSKCLPLEMRLMRNLRYLNISECNLRYIPTTVWLCVSINTLDLSRNKIGHLVPDIGNLQNLTHLNLSQCNLATLPAEVGFCADLIEIVLMANQIESLPDTLKDCKKLMYLKMSYRSFSSLLDSYMENLISKGQIKSEHVPVVVYELENLRILDLKHTKINYLPENNLKNLNNLYVDNNYFDNFPEFSLKPMTENLKILTISNNLLKEIPNELVNLVNLEILDLSFNSISSIPKRLNLINLKELLLNDNYLSSLNKSMTSLKNLERLTLNNNQLNDIADYLFDSVKLVYLDLSYNNLTKISAKICNLKCLKEAHHYEKLNKTGLWVIGNPLTIPPKEIWQTNNVKKIFDFLSSYNQRHIDHVFYSKLIFMGMSGIGKSSLIDCFYNIRHDPVSSNQINHVDYRTKVARKLLKRTINKVEWLILDFGGHDIYKSLHSTYFSSIDHENEPNVFVLVYNHSDYTTETHQIHLGSWIESILCHNKVSDKFSIQIKLIGILNNSDLKSSQENAIKMKLVSENCKLTIKSYYSKLIDEKIQIDSMLNTSNELSDNQSYLSATKSDIDFFTKRKINLIDEIFLIESSFSKESVECCLNVLESLTIRLNKSVPLDLRAVLKGHLASLNTDSINLDDFISGLQSSVEIQTFIKNNKRFELNIEKIVNYAKTIGEIFWLKNNKNLCKKIYLRFEYILSCLRLFIRHDLKQELDLSKKSIFRSCGIFKSEHEYSLSVDLFKKYGVLEQMLIKYICFSSSQLSQSEIKDAIDLLQDLSIIYKSETRYIEDKCSYFQIVVPTMCVANFGQEKATESNWDSNLYLDEFERYFIRLNQIRCYKEEVKEMNALRKQKEIWNSQETDLFNNEYYGEIESDPLYQDPRILSSPSHESQFLGIEPIKCNIIDTQGNYKFINEDQLASKYKHKCFIELVSPFRMEKHVFDKISVLIQDIAYERFDWIDTIVARDENETCMRIRVENYIENSKHKIGIEIKSEKNEFLIELKEQFYIIFDKLFDFYPGLFFTKSVTTL